MAAGVVVRENPRMRSLESLLTLNAEIVGKVAEETGKEFRRIEAKAFRSEGASQGQPWPALSPDYAKAKTRALRGALRDLRQSRRQLGQRGRVTGLRTANRILQFSGALRDSLTQKNDADHVQEFYRGFQERWYVRHGTRNILAAYHGQGALHNPILPYRHAVLLTHGNVSRIRSICTRTLKPHVLRAVKAMRALGLKAVR